MDFENHIKETSIQWNEDTVYAFGLYRRVASLLGIWPTQNRMTSAIQIGIYIIFHLTSVSILFKQFLEHGLCGTVIEIVDTGTLCLSSVQVCMKAYVAWIQQEKFQRIVNSAVEDWSRVVDNDAQGIRMKYASIGRNLLFVQMFCGMMAAVPLVFSSLPALVETNNDQNNITVIFRTIPMAPTCWISISMDPYIYYAYWISITIFLFTLGLATVCTNVFLYGFGLHVFTQFELLYISLNEIEGTENYNQQRQLIRKFSRRHDHLLGLANDLEDGGNLIILSEVSAIIIIASIAGVMLLISLNVGDNDIMFNMGVRMVLVMTQLFIYSYMGERLSNQSDKIQNAIYDCPWYQLAYKTARDMKLIMIRSNHPFQLTAGKLAVMNLMSFKETVKSMFSFFSVLRLMLLD